MSVVLQSKEMIFPRQRFFAAAAFAAVACVSICGISCKREADAHEERRQDAVAVTLAPAVVAPVQRSVEITGTLFGDEEATVSAKVPGRIVEVLHDVGDRAASGQPLAQIDKTDYELAVAQKNMAMQASLAKLGLTEMPGDDFDLNKVPTVERARLQSANAEAKFNRGRQLFEQKPPLISEQDFADLKTAFEVARSNYQVELLTARSLLADARATRSDLQLEAQRLRDTTVRIPEAATTQSVAKPAPQQYAVATRLVSIGEYVREGTPLFRLVADDPVKYRAQVPEKFHSQVKTGQPVRVQVAAYPEVFPGTVSRISPLVDRTSRTFEVEMLMPNPTGKLQPGSFATGQILTRMQENVTLVPIDALVTFAGVTKVYTVDNGKAVEKKIETGQRVGDNVEVVTGLSGAVPVVIEGKNRLATGTPVTINASTQPATQP
ncbi:MAG: rane fusion protein multidrug efflux system [Humisphaera sp.]|nr:rane fusion protein multidrug efflux system [Humisphaera sp.]